MRDAILAMRTTLYGISGIRLGALGLVLGFTLAQAPAGYADDISLRIFSAASGIFAFIFTFVFTFAVCTIGGAAAVIFPASRELTAIGGLEKVEGLDIFRIRRHHLAPAFERFGSVAISVRIEPFFQPARNLFFALVGHEFDATP